MSDRHVKAPYSLRIDDDLKAKARSEANANRRSLNAEIGLLIEEGLKWREIQGSRKSAA